MALIVIHLSCRGRPYSMQKTNIRTIKVPWLKNERKIFGAFKWNPYVMGMYEDIFEDIINDPKWLDKYGYIWQTQYGAKFSLPEDINWKTKIAPEEIEEFTLQNKQLYDIFVKGISSCDLFVADITHHNPNVMLELGIAIQQNKNILVVTSKDFSEMEFDIRGLKAMKYTSKKQLKELIEKQMEIYSEIKGQTFDNYVSGRKYAVENFQGILADSGSKQIPGIPKLKNLRMKINFKFLFSTSHSWDWFGVHLRTRGPDRYSSELVLVRHSGETRSTTFPELRKKENDGLKIANFDPTKPHTLEILIDENKLSLWVDGSAKPLLTDHELLIEEFGEVWIGSMEHRIRENNPKKTDDGKYLKIEYSNLEIIDLSTTENIFA